MRSSIAALALALVAAVAAPSVAAARMQGSSGSGGIDISPVLVVTAREISGRQALLVEGSAPHDARVTLTVLATLAPELPTVLLQRTDVQADRNGHFGAVVPVAPDYFTGSLVAVIATSGSESAATHVVLDGRPNVLVSQFLEDSP